MGSRVPQLPQASRTLSLLRQASCETELPVLSWFLLRIVLGPLLGPCPGRAPCASAQSCALPPSAPPPGLQGPCPSPTLYCDVGSQDTHPLLAAPQSGAGWAHGDSQSGLMAERVMGPVLPSGVRVCIPASLAPCTPSRPFIPFLCSSLGSSHLALSLW